MVPEHSTPGATAYPLGPLTVAVYVTPADRDTRVAPSLGALNDIGIGPPATAIMKSLGVAVPNLLFFTATDTARFGVGPGLGLVAVLGRPHVNEPTLSETIDTIASH
jgi:hypothetical protein